jgi:cell division transport system ATP-binding protein
VANHFRGSERQGTEELELDAQAQPQTPEPMTVHPAVSEEEVDAIVNSLAEAALSEPVLSEPEDTLETTTAEEDESVNAAFADSTGSVPSAPNPTDDSVSVPAFSVPDPLAEPAPMPQPMQEAAPMPAPVMRPVIEEPAPAVSREGTPTISLRNVTVIYPAQPNKPALEDVSLDIYPGEFVFLVGHSGSGKSTFIRLLNRELRATSGKVMVAGQDLTRMRNWKVPYLRRQIGCVFQDFKLLPDKTTYENVAFALECIGKPRSVINVQVPEVLRLVGLADRMDAYPDQLSGGEQQRVSVARAMVNRPPLLICDEPTGNLDPAISLGIMKLLDRINRTGTTVVMATHDRDMVDSMRRRVIALEAGHVVRDQERGGYGNYGVL